MRYRELLPTFRERNQRSVQLLSKTHPGEKLSLSTPPMTLKSNLPVQQRRSVSEPDFKQRTRNATLYIVSYHATKTRHRNIFWKSWQGDNLKGNRTNSNDSTYSLACFESFDFLNMYSDTPTAIAAVPMIATVFPVDMAVVIVESDHNEVSDGDRKECETEKNFASKGCEHDK